jgi:hypothetical protein
VVAFFPYLFAVFPILSILSTNAGEIPLYLAASPILIALMLTASASLLLRLILRDPHKRAAVLLLALTLFWASGTLIDSLRNILSPDAVSSTPQKTILALCIALPGLFIIHRLRKSHRSLIPLTRFLNAASLASILTAA